MWFLLVSLVVIVVGSFAGEWLAINRMIADATRNFWFGHQGYEYVDLGRFWQIYLFVGLLLWVVLVLRGLWPALRQRQKAARWSFLVVIATVSIGLLFGAGLMYGQNTHISIMEYWRWWVVHLWVEGVFEVFATAIVSALLVRMGLVRRFGGDDVRAGRHDHLPRRRRARHVPPSLLRAARRSA